MSASRRMIRNNKFISKHLVEKIDYFLFIKYFFYLIYKIMYKKIIYPTKEEINTWLDPKEQEKLTILVNKFIQTKLEKSYKHKN